MQSDDVEKCTEGMAVCDAGRTILVKEARRAGPDGRAFARRGGVFLVHMLPGKLLAKMKKVMVCWTAKVPSGGQCGSMATRRTQFQYIYIHSINNIIIIKHIFVSYFIFLYIRSNSCAGSGLAGHALPVDHPSRSRIHQLLVELDANGNGDVVPQSRNYKFL